MLCYRFSDPGRLNITERLIFKYGDCYYAFNSLLPSQTQSNHKRVSHFRLERWLRKGIELVTYGKDHKFPGSLIQYLEDIPVESLAILCKYHREFELTGYFLVGDKDITKFTDVILD